MLLESPIFSGIHRKHTFQLVFFFFFITWESMWIYLIFDELTLSKKLQSRWKLEASGRTSLEKAPSPITLKPIAEFHLLKSVSDHFGWPQTFFRKTDLSFHRSQDLLWKDLSPCEVISTRTVMDTDKYCLRSFWSVKMWTQWLLMPLSDAGI